MTVSEVLEQITARRAELDVLAEELTKRLEEVRAERDELAVAEQVVRRLCEQAAAEARAPKEAQVAGRAVLLVPHRVARSGADELALPEEYRTILTVVQAADGPVMVKQVCKAVGMGAEPRFLEPMRGKLNRLAERGWLRKTPTGQFTAVL
ncbi:hypothetical protein [Streptomyces sp. NPDC001978]|uniref:hypothetical protein n=1 Tax=Streptomyces sp. NPDC001978 TaxID=3364627 RepID=UPI00369BE553